MLAAHGLTYPADYDFALEGSHVERWKALQAGRIDAALQMIPYDAMATDAGFTNLGPVTEEFAFNAVCINILSAERPVVTAFLAALAEAAEWFRGNLEASAAIAAARTSIEPRYAAGCDGAASVVRAAAGIEFTGTPDTWRTILGDVELADPPQVPALTLNQPGGSMYLVAIGGGRYRVAVIDHATLHDPVDKPVTFGELRASALRLAGTDFGMRETPGMWLSRVGNAARQAACYRAGRVLLAGDAAHIHYPAGGQGLNLGLQDATNLGWKLAAEIRGWAPGALLDSYHTERFPVGLDVIDDSLAQCGLIATASREGIGSPEIIPDGPACAPC